MSEVLLMQKLQLLPSICCCPDFYLDICDRQGRAPPRVRTTYTDAERLAPLRTMLKVSGPDSMN